MTPVVMETGGTAMAREPWPGSGTAVSLGLGGGGGAAPPEGSGTAAVASAWMGKTFWHLVHFSFAPPGGMRRSSRLYVAWQDGHVTLMWDSRGYQNLKERSEHGR